MCRINGRVGVCDARTSGWVMGGMDGCVGV